MFFKIPKYKKDVWWNQSVHMKSEKYPQVFDASKQYIECEIGKEVKMGETNFGYDVLYRVVKIWKERGSDWLYDSDAINCNLQFSKLLKQK